MHNISYRSNQKISSKNVRVVDPDGVNLGILELEKALSLAENYGLDLVEISPESQPPVCRIISLSKLKYQAQIKTKESKKGSTKNEVKDEDPFTGISTRNYLNNMENVDNIYRK
jgi:translation initiation factor IF-3